jgi:glycerol-3-phosphate dehydrogenase
MKGHVKTSIKCLDFSPTGPLLLTDRIQSELGLANIAVMMGANIASDIAYDKFVETTSNII